MLLVSCGIVLVINVASNYEAYKAGANWKQSIAFSLAITLVGVVGGTLVLPAMFRRFNWAVRPTQKLLFSVLIYAVFGVLLMIGGIKVMFLITGHEESSYEYKMDSVFSALFSIIFGLIASGRQFLVSLQAKITENERMKAEMVQARYDALKNQVSPHFFFNSLNTLAAIIPGEPDVAVQFVEEMARVFRYSLQHSDDVVVDIAAELKVVRSYLFLNEQRFAGKLKVSIDIPGVALAQSVITHSLLMLAENAIKHNEISSAHPLFIDLYVAGNYLVVRNSLRARSLSEPGTGLGLANIKERYLLAGMGMVEVMQSGEEFTVKLPLANNGRTQ